MDKVLEYIVIAVFVGFMLTFVGGFVYFVLLVLLSVVTAPFALVSAARRIPWNAPTHHITRHARAHRIDSGRRACLVWQRDGRIDVYGAISCTWYGSIATDKTDKREIRAEMEHLVRRVPYLDPPYLDKKHPPPGSRGKAGGQDGPDFSRA